MIDKEQKSAEIAQNSGTVKQKSTEVLAAASAQEPFGWVKSSEIKPASAFGGSVNLWLEQYDCDTPLYTAPQPAAPQAAPAVDDDLWYLQDTRCYVGNDVLWWAKDGKGYTTDVSKAHAYNRAEAFRQAAMRGTDRAWPKRYIDSKTRPVVDMQYINHDAALAAQGGA